MSGACGTCTACCKLMGVPELDKPTNKWCDKCHKGSGCAIYDSRPPSCREYECVWLQTQDVNGWRMPAELRPDRCHVVLSLTADRDLVTAHVDPGHPNAWREGEFFDKIVALASNGVRVVVSHGQHTTEKKLVERRSSGVVGIRTIKMSEPDENGTQWADIQ